MEKMNKKMSNNTKLQITRRLSQLMFFGLLIAGVYMNLRMVIIVFLPASLLFGNFFCGWACPFGSIQEVMGNIGKKLFKKQYKMPRKVQKYLQYSKYVLFVIVMIGVLDFILTPLNGYMSFLGLFSEEMMSMISTIALVIMGIYLLLSMVFERAFCNYLCTESAKYGVLSMARIFSIKRNTDSCISCKKCDKACPMNIEVSAHEHVRNGQCINCFKCVDACMRILLAEDEKDLSEALTIVLQKNNYSVDAVYDGQDAVDYIEAGNYDAGIFDIMMPKKDGLEALKEIREKGADIPILLLTAKAEISDRVEGLDCGADDYLTKPFAIDELLARIRTMTRRKSVGRAENHKVLGNVKLDVLNSEIISDGCSAFLGNKEFQMMEIFMNNKEQFISADRLFERIWGYDHEADMSVVWVNISNLRKKLRKIGANIEINAKRNIGYRLVIVND